MHKEVEHFASAFAELGRRILVQCQDVPEPFLHWPAASSGSHSLFALALKVITTVEEQILLPIGGKHFSSPVCARVGALETYTHLKTAYEQWIQEVHELLLSLPNAMLDCYVKSPLDHISEDHINEKISSVRSRLLATLEAIAVILGQMQIMRELLLGGETIFQEIEQANSVQML